MREAAHSRVISYGACVWVCVCACQHESRWFDTHTSRRDQYPSSAGQPELPVCSRLRRPGISPAAGLCLRKTRITSEEQNPRCIIWSVWQCASSVCFMYKQLIKNDIHMKVRTCRELCENRWWSSFIIFKTTSNMVIKCMTWQLLFIVMLFIFCFNRAGIKINLKSLWLQRHF